MDGCEPPITIQLSDLIALIDDTGTLRHLNALLGDAAAAGRAIAEAMEAIDASDDELLALGVSTEPDEAGADAEEGRDDAAVPRGARTDIEDAPCVASREAAQEAGSAG